MNDWMSAPEAAQRLGVSRATLYAYVSRGLLASHARPGGRGSRYRTLEVMALVKQRASARQPRQAARASLDFGLPVLASSLSLISRGQLHYRGHEATAFAQHADLEATAALLWPADEAALRELRPAVHTVPAGRAARALPPLAAFHLHAAALPAEADGVPHTSIGMHLVWAMAQALVPRVLPRPGEPVHRALQRAWRLPAPAGEALRTTLVLCADHELNASSFSARCVASTGASLSACIGAGLAALTGPRHGGVTERVEAWLDAGRPPELRAGAPAMAGFGHALYPDGDPRARAILQLLPRDAEREALLRRMQRHTGLHPSLDFALVALRRSLGLPRGSAFAMFAIARTVGWVAHVLEQRRDGGLIRPRAAYVGLMPAAAVSAQPPPGRVIRRR